MYLDAMESLIAQTSAVNTDAESGNGNYGLMEKLAQATAFPSL